MTPPRDRTDDQPNRADLSAAWRDRQPKVVLTDEQRERHRIANRKWRAKTNELRQLEAVAAFDRELQAKVEAQPTLWGSLRRTHRRKCEGCGRYTGRVVYAGWSKGVMRYGAMCRFCAADWVALGGSAVVRWVKPLRGDHL